MTGEPDARRRVLVTGAAGMLGSQLLRDAPEGVEAFGTDLAAPAAPDVAGAARFEAGVDLCDPAALARLFERAGPFDGVIHAAAYTAVDRAEEEEPLALRVNGELPGLVAQACARARIPLVLVSTDFVFDGTKGSPYVEDDPPSPLGAYGRTKLTGEERARERHPGGVRIVRTQWLYGPRGAHFPGTMARLARERETWKVVADQIGSPTSTLELSPALWDVLERGEAGVYHASCEGACSWYELAVATVERLRRREALAVREIQPCSTEEYPVPAPRPAYSVLSCERLTSLRGRALASWERALDDFLEHEAGLASAGGTA